MEWLRSLAQRLFTPGQLRGYSAAILAVALASVFCSLAVGRFDNSNLIMVYLLALVFVASRYGRGPSVLAAIASVAVFDFFFVPPHFTFAVADTQYVVTFAVMLVVGVLVSTLTAREREAAELALQRERRTQSLYALSRELAGLRTSAEVAAAAARHASALFQSATAVFLPQSGVLELYADPPGAFGSDRDRVIAQRTLESSRTAGATADQARDAKAIFEPLIGQSGCLGVLAIQLPDRAQPLPREQRDLVAAVSRQIVAPIERARAAADAEQARLAVESERLRSTLLSSVSHDLRTPLAAITGAASGVLDGLPPEMTPARELLATVVEEAERLDRLVGNLLDMTRLEAGALEPKREWLTLEEIVGSAVDRVERYAGQGIVDVEVAPDLPLAFIDGVLIEQAIVNLLENAVRHGEGESIAISARKDGDSAVVEVSDRGPGFLAENAARLFEKFHRFADGAGSGLGLAIARAIVTAHGGRIQAERLDPHGARFAFTLPLSQTPPKAPVEDLPDVAD